MVYKDLQPISIVENEGFREYSKALNPTYSLPSRKTVSKSLLPAAYEEKKNSLKNVLSAVQNICLTVDCWSNQKAESYMAVTGHFIDEHMQRKTVLIDCSIFDERHSAKNIAENIIHICQPYFPMEKVSLIVTDNAKNMINAVDSELKLKHLGCIAHSLNLAVTNSLNEVNDLLTKIRDIVIVYRRSNIAAKNLRKYLCSSEERKDLKVILDVKTRWNSTFYMVKRFLELKDAIRSTMGLMNDPPEALDVPEWESVQHLCDVLKPLKR
ncbi:zinc finger BED domain-containing protein 4-like [Stegodyphus dumicola]|uniref:zinc finger BED domain-containing protein 4-like n=1 Tax=Stegodyphus dumicola TaxID=202533 RepID=UPI0015AE7FF9|nr:zinc finger BED domain-containing protein 4-like [Stegodyphus dumicola]